MRLRSACARSGCLAALLPLEVAAELSQKVRSEIVASFPAYTPPPPEAPKPFGTPAPLSDDPLVTLPNYRVEDKRVPTPDPDAWLGRSELQKKQMREYKKSLTPLAWALNSWYIPVIGTSPSSRAKAEYDDKRMREEMQRLNSIADAVAKMDPAEAKKLKAAMDPAKLPKS